MRVRNLFLSICSSLFVSLPVLAQENSNSNAVDDMAKTLKNQNPFQVDVRLVESMMPVFKIILSILFVIVLWQAGNIFWKFLQEFIKSVGNILSADKIDQNQLKNLAFKSLLVAVVIALVVIFVSGNFMNVIIAILKLGSGILDKLTNAFTQASSQ